MNVRFSPDNRWVVSVGGSDRSGMQWRVLREAQDEVQQATVKCCLLIRFQLASSRIYSSDVSSSPLLADSSHISPFRK